MTAPIHEVQGRKFKAVLAKTEGETCRGCDARGLSLCQKMPECSVVGEPDVIFKEVKE